MNKFWSDIVAKLTPYTPGEQPKVSNLIKLNTNENPFGPSPAVLAAISTQATVDLRLYPDPNSDKVKEAVAGFYKINADQVFVGNGSDEILAHTFQALLKHDLPVLFPDITYSFYPVYCGLYAIDYKTIPLSEDFQINVHDYAVANGGIIFPNPNAPTGCLLPLKEIEKLLVSHANSVVVVDEAYVDFGGDTAVPLIQDHPNLLVIQTLSKSRSLAGLRVGFAMGHAGLIEALERVKNSFNSYPLDRLAIAGAVAAMTDVEYFEQTRNAVITSREKLVNDLKALGFDVLPSSANFLFVRHSKHPAEHLAQKLRERHIIVRHFKQHRIENFLRITVGTDSQCLALTNALQEILT